LKLTSELDDPDVWLTTLEDLKNQLINSGSNMTDDDLLEHALNNVPKAYDVEVTMMEERLGATENPLTILELCERLNLRYQKLKQEGKTDRNKPLDETALFAGGFKGKCNNCGAWGHKSVECPQRQNNHSGSQGQGYQPRRFTGQCYYCGLFGHKAVNCHKKARDKANGTQQSQQYDNANFAQDDDVSVDGIALLGHDLELLSDDNASSNLDDLNLKNDNNQISDDFFDTFGPNEPEDDDDGIIDDFLPYPYWDFLDDDMSEEDISLWDEEDEDDDNLIKKETDDLLLSMTDGKPEKNENIFIADSGASTHMVHTDKGMFDCKAVNETIVIGNGKGIKAEKIGKLRATVCQQDGTEHKIILTDVKHVPSLKPYNLFSVTKALDNGFNIGNEKTTLTITKGDFKICFDNHLRTRSGWIAGIEIKPRIQNSSKLPRIKPGIKININGLHEVFGHASEDTTKQTAKYYNLQVAGSFSTCENCAKGKARQKNISKDKTATHTKTIGEQLSFDISSIKSVSYGGSKFWLLVIDQASDFCWSYFLKSKSETVKIIVTLIKNLKAQHNYDIKYLQCDNAGENLKTQQLCEREGLGVKFEFTAPQTPQQNGVCEQNFAMLYG